MFRGPTKGQLSPKWIFFKSLQGAHCGECQIFRNHCTNERRPRLHCIYVCKCCTCIFREHCDCIFHFCRMIKIAELGVFDEFVVNWWHLFDTTIDLWRCTRLKGACFQWWLSQKGGNSNGTEITDESLIRASSALRSGSTIANEVHPRRGYC